MFVTVWLYFCGAKRVEPDALKANSMEKEKAEKIVRIYNWIRFIILILFLGFVMIGLSNL